jgi:hypothetical protein
MLWAGPPPAVCSAPPPTTSAELQALAARLQPLSGVASQPPAAAAQLPIEPEPRTDELARLRLQAARCELTGELEQAAQLLERIGDFAAAGRLYERAAEKLRAR